VKRSTSNPSLACTRFAHPVFPEERVGAAPKGAARVFPALSHPVPSPTGASRNQSPKHNL